MKKIIFIILTMFLISVPAAFSKDVYIKGYTRKDGTYVRPHIRSAPNNSKSDNYGPSKSDSELMNPRSRDHDGDGNPNYLDKDDDNDGISDDNDNKQYGQ